MAFPDNEGLSRRQYPDYARATFLEQLRAEQQSINAERASAEAKLAQQFQDVIHEAVFGDGGPLDRLKDKLKQRTQTVLADQSAELFNKIETQKGKVADQQALVTTLRERLVAINKEIVQLKTNLATATDENKAGIEQSLKAKEAEKHSLESQLEQAQLELSQAQADLQALQDQKTQTDDALTNVRDLK